MAPSSPDLDVIAPPLKRNPSAWSQRVPIAILLAAFWGPLHRLRFATFCVALFLIGYGWLQPRPVLPAHQNHILLGLLLAMSTLIPIEALQPPQAWRRSGRDGAADAGADG